MMLSYAFSKNRIIKHHHIIKNFTDNFATVNKDKIWVLKSPTYIVEDKEFEFFIRTTFSTKSISCSLQLQLPEKSIRLEGQLSVVNKNDEIFKTVNVKARINTSNCSLVVLPELEIELNDLLLKTWDLFPENNLKIVCNLTIFGDVFGKQLLNIPRQHQTIKDNLKELLSSQSGSDVVFEVDGQEFNVHKIILMARSPVFLAMFNSDMVEAKLNRVKIEDISPSIFELVIEFIYSDEITTELDLKTGIDLLKAASKYQLEGLEALCERELYTLLTPTNAMDLLLLAEAYNCVDFIKSIKNYITIHKRDIQNIIKPEYFWKNPHHFSLFFDQD